MSFCCATCGTSISIGETPLKLVKGRERIYFEHFWNDFAANPKKSVSEADRRFYAKAYAQPGAMAAGFEVFRAFEQDAKDFAELAQTKLTDADAGADRREGVGRIPDRSRAVWSPTTSRA